MSRIVSNQVDASLDHELARFASAQQPDFVGARLQQSRGQVRERVIDVARVHHELGHTRSKSSKNAIECARVQPTGLYATYELRRAKPVLGSDPIVSRQ